MSLAEELLNTVSENVVTHKHTVTDTDPYFSINPETRAIESTSLYNIVLMQYDHNSQRYTFELPRYIDGHDMSLCTSVVVNYDNIEINATAEAVEVEIEPESPRINSSSYDMTDLRINPDNPEMVISSWLVSRESTQLAGNLSFSIEYKCTDSEGNVTYEFGTDNFADITVKPRKKNSEAAITPYADVLEQWRSQIFGAGDSVMANIAAEGEEQVAAVKMESKTQQEAVELKGVQTLESIPEDYTEVDVMAEKAVRTKSDAIVCESEGETITISDSSDDHIRGLKVFGKSTQFTTTGKNKLNLGKQVERIVNGVTLTPVYDSNGNLSYLNVNGTSASTFILLSVPFNIAAGNYIFTNFIGRTVEDGTLHAQICDSNSGLMYPQDMGLGGDFTFEEDLNLIYRIYIAEGRTVNNERFYPMIRLASVTDATYEPYTGGKPSPNPEHPQEIESVENTTVNIYGKNLWNPEDNTVDISVDEGVWGWGTTLMKNPELITILKPNTTYTMRAKATCMSVPEYETVFSDNCGFVLYSGVPGGQYMNMAMSTGEGALKVGETRNIFGTFTTPDDMSDSTMNYEILRYTQRYLTSSGEATYAKVRFEDFQIEVGTTATDYEPYKPVQPITTTQSLPGLPVTSGGNYTDSDGQQWICDEIDLERGVLVQRLGNAVRDASSDEYWYKVDATGGPIFAHVLNDAYANGSSKVLRCSHFSASVNGAYNRTDNACYFYDKTLRISHLDITDLDLFKEWLGNNPITIMYPLATPIETPLTAEEITAFKSLRTNYPNTTILNDAGAWMSVKYNADTKTYVENPKTLKLVDSSTGVVYELKIVDGSLTVTPV